MKLELHPLCALFPRMTGGEFESLKADIKANGLSQPIVTHNGMVLDGGNRYAACVALGIEPVMKDYVGENLVTYVMSANFHRRHLNAGQMAAIVSSAQDWAKAQTAGNPAFKSLSGNVTGLDTVASRQAQSGASDKTQRMADKVAKENPDLSIQVAHGEISLPKALEQISPKKQKKAKKAKKTKRTKPAAPVISDDDMATHADLMQQMEDTQAENEDLQERVAMMSLDDKGAQIDKLLDRVRGLEGRLAQAMAQINASEETTRIHAALIHKLRKLLHVEGHKAIYDAVAALVKEQAEA